MSEINFFEIILFFAGVLISYYFFRSEQVTDFKKLYAQIQTITASISTIEKATDVEKSVNLTKQLEHIKGSVERLSQQTNNLGDKILAEIRKEQRVLIETAQQDFEAHVDNSREILVSHIRRELLILLPPGREKEKEQKIEKLVDFATHALQSMGQFQRASIELKSEEALNKVEKNILKAVGEVSDDVKSIEDQLSALPEATSSTLLSKEN